MVLAAVSLSPMLAVEDAPRTAPPPTPENDVVENYHGGQVQDPYRWLEEAGAPAVEQWIDSQNAYMDAVKSGFRDHGAIIKRVGQLALTSTITAMGTSRTIETSDAGPAMSGECL